MVEPAPGTTLLDAAKGDLVLRILGTSHHGQIVRLRRPKCVIGSGPACTLRVRARGVRPVHCVILRGSADTVVRRWSADTRLNGRGFTDARLSPGDRLSVGPVEFEVLDTGAGSQDSPGDFDAVASQLAARHAEFDARQVALDTRRSELAAREAELADRQASLEALQTELKTLPAHGGGPEEPVGEPPEGALQRPSDRAPVDTRAVFSRLGLDVPADDAGEDRPSGPDEPACAGSGRSGEMEDKPSGPGATAGRAHDGRVAESSTESFEEESIDDYMARLLNRVRAGSGGSKFSESLVETPATEGRGLSSQPGADPVETSAVSAQQGQPMPIARRAVTAEDTANLDAMRELANLSAHAAIDRHARRRLLRMSGAKLIGVLLSLLSGGAMIWMWWYFGAGELTFYTGLVVLLIALSWGVQYALLTGRLIVSRSGRVQWKWRKRGGEVQPPPRADKDESHEG